MKIGGIFDITGANAGGDIDAERGLQLGVDDWNKKGGFTVAGKKYTFDLQNKDSQSSSATAASAASELLSGFGASVLYGGGFTGEVGPEVSAVLRAGTAVYFAGATVMDTYVGKGTPIFRSFAPTTTLIDNYFVPDLAKTVSWKKIAIALPDDATGTAVIGLFEPALEAAGIKVTQVVRFDPAETNFVPILSKIRNVDAVMIGYSDTVVRAIVQASVAAGLPQNFIAFGASTAAIAGLQNQIDTYVSFNFNGKDSLAPSSAGEKSFLDAYKATFHVAPDANTSLAYFYYDSLGLVVQAMQAAGTTTDARAIAAKIRGRTYQGQILKLSYNSKGIDQTSGGITVEYKGGKIKNVG